MNAQFNDLLGKTLVNVDGMVKGSDCVVFRCSDGSEYFMQHQQDCCESVYLEDVAGEVEDLLGSPLLQAEEVSNFEEPPLPDFRDMSYTWTFYRLTTMRGQVVLRWFGTSNGYYSEKVSFFKA